ncbi:hypothetical protein [Mesorhizobium sp. M0859]|uniref:hypothetical protein n=1 Tax=Mesorhizobium sp. M0859 TaxID=2957014 RepID=UPI00333D7197
MSSGKTLTAEMLADALGCFWNAAIGDARDKQDSRVLAVASSMAEGFAAVERRLREHAQPAPTSAADGEVVEAIKKQIILAMQLRDFGHTGTGGQFHTSAPKIAMLEECSEKAATAIAALNAPAVPAPMGGAGEMVERINDLITSTFEKYGDGYYDTPVTILLRDIRSALVATPPAPPAPPSAVDGEVVKALKFYADPANWIDTPSWDGDPTCITPKAIPVTKEDGRPCDCGDMARAALLTALAAPAVDVDDLIKRITSFLSGHLSGPIQSRGNALLEEAAAVLSKAQAIPTSAVEEESVLLKQVVNPLFTFYRNCRYKVVNRTEYGFLLEDERGNRATVHESFIVDEAALSPVQS